MTRYVDAVEPTVIDEELARKCISIPSSRESPQSSEAHDTKRENLEFNEVTCLIFSFKNILKIDNLVGFDKLTKLQLDNNVIERIENLGHLVNLEWLDLSFNNISEIEGLESLTTLTNFSLFNNRITTMHNMDTLTNLHVFSIGNNLIKNMDNVMYLRSFPKLQAINFAGNPFCKEAEYRAYVLAHIKHLRYLDYRLVDEAAVVAAKEQYQESLLDLEEEEGHKEQEVEHEQIKTERASLLKEANLEGIESLFDDMLKADAEMNKLKIIPNLMEPLDEFREKFNSLVEEYVGFILEQHVRKAQEKALFLEAVEQAKESNAQDSLKEISKFNEFKKKALKELKNADPMTHHQHLQVLQDANEALYNRLMDLEMQQVEQFSECINEFDANYGEIFTQNMEASQNFFIKLREVETAYAEVMQGLGAELLEKMANGELEEQLSDDAKALMNDKDAFMGWLTTSNETHVSKLDAKEDDISSKESDTFDGLMNDVRDDEYKRNRQRVSELWSLVNVINRKELEEYMVDDMDAQ